MSLGTMEQRTEGMKKQAKELIEQAYQRGFKAGKESDKDIFISGILEQGRNEAWEAAKKISLPVLCGGLYGGEVEKIFGVKSFATIFQEFSASEAIEKLRAYEENKEQEEDNEIHVGDEVVLNANSSFDANTKAIITAIKEILITDVETYYLYDVMVEYGNTACVDKNDIDCKTGRHFPEIAEVLKKLQEGMERN